MQQCILTPAVAFTTKKTALYKAKIHEHEPNVGAKGVSLVVIHVKLLFLISEITAKSPLLEKGT